MSHKPIILVVDDTPDHLIILSDLLEAAGYHVLVAESGAGGIERAGHANPNLIFMDVRMPGLSGYATCRYLKAQPDLRDIPIVFMSAHRDRGGLDDAIAVGGIDFVRKPFDRQEVLTKVQAHLQIQ